MWLQEPTSALFAWIMEFRFAIVDSSNTLAKTTSYGKAIQDNSTLSASSMDREIASMIYQRPKPLDSQFYMFDVSSTKPMDP